MENFKQKNEVIFQIKNHILFNEKVNDVDTSGLISRGADYRGNSRGFDGVLSIELKEDRFYKTISGQFGPKNYENEWGFVLISKWEIKEKLADLKKEKKELKIQIEDLKDLF